MIAIDTNVLVRFATQDDERQFAVASTFIASLSRADQGFLGIVVLVETWWVLSRGYGYEPAQSIRFLTALLDSEELVIEQPDVVRAALGDAETGADFADAVIARGAAASGCTATVTFDRRAANRAGMTLLD